MAGKSKATTATVTPTVATPQAPVAVQVDAAELAAFRAYQERQRAEAQRQALEDAFGIERVTVGPHPSQKGVSQYNITLNVPESASMAFKGKNAKSPNRDLPIFTNERSTAYVPHAGIPCALRIDMYGTRAEDAGKVTGLKTVGKSTRNSDGTYTVTYSESELAWLTSQGISPNA